MTLARSKPSAARACVLFVLASCFGAGALGSDVTRSYASGAPTTITVAPKSTPRSQTPSTRTVPQLQRTVPAKRRRTWWDRNGDALEVVIIGGMVVAIGGALVRLAVSRRRRSQVAQSTATEPDVPPFNLIPVNGSGENVMHRSTEGGRFYIRLHVVLWTRYGIELLNMDVDYDWPQTMAGGYEATVNGTRCEHDASFRFTTKIALAAAESADIVVRREFLTELDPSEADYGRVIVRFELATQSGLATLLAEGQLAPDGRIEALRFGEVALGI